MKWTSKDSKVSKQKVHREPLTKWSVVPSARLYMQRYWRKGAERWQLIISKTELPCNNASSIRINGSTLLPPSNKRLHIIAKFIDSEEFEEKERERARAHFALSFPSFRQ